MHSKFRSILLFSLLTVLSPLTVMAAAAIEEIVVKASYRETTLEKNDGSLMILSEEQLKAEPMKHLEQLSF